MQNAVFWRPNAPLMGDEKGNGTVGNLGIISRGGGGLGMEKGTDCGPSATERWLKRGGCPLIIVYNRGAV